MTRKKLISLIVGIVLIVVLVIALNVWRRATATPSWWSTSLPDNLTSETANPAGAQLERAVTSAISEPRTSDESWDLVITEQQASSWLTGRLPRWLANRSVAAPENWTRTAVAFRDGEIEVAAELTADSGAARYVGVVLTPRIDPATDTLLLSADAATLGRLRTPFSLIADRLAPQLDHVAQSSDDPAKRDALHRFIDSHTISVQPAGFPLDDGRLLRISEIKVEEGRLFLRCRTTRPAPTERRN